MKFIARMVISWPFLLFQAFLDWAFGTDDLHGMWLFVRHGEKKEGERRDEWGR